MEETRRTKTELEVAEDTVFVRRCLNSIQAAMPSGPKLEDRDISRVLLALERCRIPVWTAFAQQEALARMGASSG